MTYKTEGNAGRVITFVELLVCIRRRQDASAENPHAATRDIQTRNKPSRTFASLLDDFRALP